MDGFHRDATKKRGHDCSAPDHGPMRTPYPANWAVLTDKGYQGAADGLRVLYPKKKPPHRRLTLDEERGNAELASDRVIVENYVRRQCTLWTIIGSNFRWSESCYDSIFQFIVAFANYHIGWHPLREGDGVFYTMLCNRQYEIGESTARKRKMVQQQYQARRKQRVAPHSNRGEDSEASTIGPDYS